MLAYYGTQISPNQTETVEGYLICKNVPIARTGTQEYLARELQLDGDPERIVTVDRPPEEVFSQAALASFEGKPVTDGHPAENVTPENYSAYSRGHVQNVRREGDFVLADLYINDANLSSDIKNGVKREISCGYLCNYDPQGAGYRQIHIRGNHVAVVPVGRAGHEVSIKDTAPEAEKGSTNMSKFSNAILNAFGMAAKDASPDEMEGLVKTASDALEAAPAEKAPEAAPANDVMVERAPKGDDLGSKLDKVIEMLANLEHKNDREEKKLSDESDLDHLLEKLTPEKKEEAVTVPADEMEEDACGVSQDTAIELIRKLRPAVAAIPDKAAKARVTDALISSLTAPSSVIEDIFAATQRNARKANDSRADVESRCKEQEALYAARNPHTVKEEK